MIIEGMGAGTATHHKKTVLNLLHQAAAGVGRMGADVDGIPAVVLGNLPT